MTAAVDVTLRIGGVFASDRPAVVRTVLGSCVAVCLFDPVSRVGGMNHYMLPSSADVLHREDPARYGLQAMEVLLGQMQKLGARRDRLIAKLFGGGHVLNQLEPHAASVSLRNIEFIRRYADEEELTVVSHDLGGQRARAVHFYTHTGKALVKRLGDGLVTEVVAAERKLVARGSIPMNSDITLFDD
ncbi:MAG TPA: chemotaxis protein CheD [Polyangiales bacterium]